MSSTVERIRQEIDLLAPDEVRELFTDLQQEYPLRFLQVEGEGQRKKCLAFNTEMNKLQNRQLQLGPSVLINFN
jgi:hypothetical protein